MWGHEPARLERHSSRRWSYLAVAALLATGAPLGLLVLRALRAPEVTTAWLLADVRGDLPTYLYVTVSTLAVFSAFGYALGWRADRLLALTRTDPLTGLANLRAFRERLEQEFAQAQRHGHALTLLSLDVDELKAINDSKGHRAGDEALRAVASAIRDGSRVTDLAARIGGDEFAVLAPQTTDEEAFPLAQRIRTLVMQRAPPEPHAALTVSVGLATWSSAAPGSPEDLLAAADAALYRAKREGRNRVARE